MKNMESPKLKKCFLCASVVKNGFAQGLSKSSEMLKMKRYASFAKTGKERRFWQKRHTGDVSKSSGWLTPM